MAIQKPTGVRGKGKASRAEAAKLAAKHAHAEPKAAKFAAPEPKPKPKPTPTADEPKPTAAALKKAAAKAEADRIDFIRNALLASGPMTYGDVRNGLKPIIVKLNALVAHGAVNELTHLCRLNQSVVALNEFIARVTPCGTGFNEDIPEGTAACTSYGCG